MQVRLRKSQLGFGLFKLLVQIGGLNHSKLLPCLYMRADIRIPALQVSVGSSKNGGFEPGPDLRRQHQTITIRSWCGRDNRHRRDGQLGGVSGRRTALTPTWQEAEQESRDEYQRDNGSDDQSAPGRALS